MYDPYKFDIPRFVGEGYATLEDGDFYAKDSGALLILKGENIKDYKRIGIKEDAPFWAKHEHQKWQEAFRQMCEET